MTLQWTPPKDPTATKDYSFDWTGWLNGSTIASATWTLDSASGLTSAKEQINGAVTTIWLSGGNPGTFEVECEITTNDAFPLIEPRRALLTIENT